MGGCDFGRPLLFIFLFSLVVVINADYKYAIKYFEVPVDHFSFSTNATFKMRYLINDTYWNKESGPIFFYTGNEGDIKMFAENTGFMWDIAPEFKAMLVFAEHRYYGESLPFGNKSFSSAKTLGYLTAQQALEDYVDLISSLRSSAHRDKLRKRPVPVIAFGGSYGGMLAAWFRMKYPHVVQGALAASAPILQFETLVKCKSFYRILSSDFRAVNESCEKSIRRSWDVINDKTSTDGGKAWLSTSWKLCHPITNKDGVQKLKDWLIDIYTNLGMLDYPYPTNFLTPLPANPITEVCQYLTNSSLPNDELLGHVFKAVSVYFNFTGSATCLDVGQQAGPGLGIDGWDFQACTEMVMPMCSDGERDMMEPQSWDEGKYMKDCEDKFWGIKPAPKLVVHRYGGLELAAASSNIIFSNGLRDPWASGGVMKSLSETVLAVIIPEGAHHLDLRAKHENDPESVTQARNIYKKEFSKWIAKHYE